MKRGTITRVAAAALLSGAALLLPSTEAQTSLARSLSRSGGASSLQLPGAPAAGPSVWAPTERTLTLAPVANPTRQFPWRTNIVTTVFWIGEKPTANNPVPNISSSWDMNWTANYGGYDNPDPAQRRDLIPIKFTPRQNPFYVALPYNDKARVGHRPEAPDVVPWFKEAYQGPAVSTCKGRWVAIRKGNKIAYAQWEDAGPFRTDHWQYVFGTERPKPNLNKGAGLDVSPAVRDYLGLEDTDVTDWKFVEFKDVPVGPWARHGDNNTFVQQRRGGGTLVERQPGAPAAKR
jgi:hypothetical protein